VVEERDFYTVPDAVRNLKCHRCKRPLPPGSRYYMTDDDSWIFCETCASGRERPQGPRRVLRPAHERVPLHKKVTLREQV
jgi:RNase P subunit RPR2